MTKLILAGLRQRKLRAALTAISILLGVSMVTGTLVLTSQITRAFDQIFQSANQGVDVRVTPHTDFEGRLSAVPTLPQSIVGEIAGIDGVKKAAPEIAALGSPVVRGEYVQSSGAPSFVFALEPDPFRATTLSAGRYPDRSGEVAVNEGLAQQQNIGVGAHIGIATRNGVKPVVITGLVTFANIASIGGATITIAPLQDVQRWFNLEGRINSVAVAADDLGRAEVIRLLGSSNQRPPTTSSTASRSRRETSCSCSTPRRTATHASSRTPTCWT